MTIQIDGSLVDWTASDRLERLLPGGGSTAVPGYEIYGRFENGTFYIALHSAVAISANTTLWLNTDDNIATGTQAFGAPNVGAEFNVNSRLAPSRPCSPAAQARFEVPNALTTGGLNWELSADGHTLEVAIPKALLGANVDTISIHADVNNDKRRSCLATTTMVAIGSPIRPREHFDGVLDEWTPAQRLEVPSTTVAGYEIYGKYAGRRLRLRAEESHLIIGQNTTFWLDTDKNSATGFQAFGKTRPTLRREPAPSSTSTSARTAWPASIAAMPARLSSAISSTISGRTARRSNSLCRRR